MSSKEVEVRAGAQMERTFVINVTSTLAGYSARVTERLSDRLVVPVALHRPLREEIAPATFYQFREHYRNELLESVMCDVLSCKVTRLKDDTEPHDDVFIRANLKGWPDGFPDAVEDGLSDWDLSAD